MKYEDVLKRFVSTQAQLLQEKQMRQQQREQMLAEKAQGLQSFVPGMQGHSPEEEYTESEHNPFEESQEYEDGGIHIDPSKKGTFKAQATRMGMSVQEAASHILNNKEDYTPTMVKKANFAKNFAKEEGGMFTGDYEQYGDGGIKTHKSEDGTITNKFTNKDGDTVIQVKTADGKYYEKIISKEDARKTLGALQQTVSPEFKALASYREPTLEERVNYNLRNPQGRAEIKSEKYDKDNEPIDNIRHPFAGRYAAEALYKMRKEDTPWAPDWMNKTAAWLDANMLGVAHEAGTILRDERPWSIKLRESAEDIYNNGVGVNVGLSEKSGKQKDYELVDKALNYKIPDGMGEERPFDGGRNPWTDPYDKKRGGGEMIRRADGSYSKRGLWDNIRDNIGSGKAPTREMLEQERRIINKYPDGGITKTVKSKDGTITNVKQNNDGSKTVQVRTKDGKYSEKVIPMDYLNKIENLNNNFKEDETYEDILEFVDPTGISSYDDVQRAYNKNGLFDTETMLEIAGALPIIGKFGKLTKGLKLGTDVFKEYKLSKMLRGIDEVGKIKQAADIVFREGGSFNNPGFNALPEAVQDKIIAAMMYGGSFNNNNWD